jgi:Thioredoxin like C-terminal domain
LYRVARPHWISVARMLPPTRLALNQWSLAGEWTMGRQATVLNKASGQIVYRFHARDVHLVMGPSRPGGSVRFRVTIDGQRPGAAHGLDVDESGNGTAVEQRLYQLIRQPKPIVDRTFVIEFLDPGVEAFSFTFG